MHLWQCAKHKCSISAFCCYSKTSFHLKVYKFLDREGRFQASKCSQKGEIQNQSRHLLFRQTGKTQMPALFPFCLLRQSAEGQTAVYFSLTMFIWNQTRDRSLGTFFSTNACLVYWSKTCLDRNLGSSGSSRGWFGLDAIYLTPNRKLWIGRCGQLKHSFLCCLSVLLFFSCKAMKCNSFLVNQYVKAI